MLNTMREPRFLIVIGVFWDQIIFGILFYSTQNRWLAVPAIADLIGAYFRFFVGRNQKDQRSSNWVYDPNMLATMLWIVVVGGQVSILMHVKDVQAVVMGAILGMGAQGYVTACFAAFPAVATLMMAFLNAELTIGLMTSPFEQLTTLGFMMPLTGVGFSLLMLHAHDTLIEAILAKYENRQRSLHDPLTGLSNRLMMDEYLADLCKCQAGQGSFAILCLDLDGFKQVNDRYGHAAGDEVLTVVARILLAEVAAEGLVCRIGGDEFVVLLPLGDRRKVAELAERLITAISRPFSLVRGVKAHVGATIGAALSPQNGTDQDALLSCADDALYEAKRGGKGRWLFAPVMSSSPTTAA